MLSQKQLQNYCLVGVKNYKTCRYLYQDDMDYRKWYCSKLHQSKKDSVDNAVVDFLNECKKKGIDPKTRAVPFGDNCPGFPILKHIVQGEG
jgi:hypothetical protein